MHILKYTLEDADCLEFNKFIGFGGMQSGYKNKAKQRPISPHKVIFFNLIHLIIVPNVAIIGYFTVPAERFPITLAVLFALWIALFFTWKTVYVATLKLGMKTAEKVGVPLCSKNIKLELGEDGLVESSELSETKVAYANIAKVLEDSNAIYILINTIQVFIVPHRAFENEQQKTDFLSFIREKVQNHN